MKTKYVIKENGKTVYCKQYESNIVFTIENKEIIRNMNSFDISFLRYINKKYNLNIDFSYII